MRKPQRMCVCCRQMCEKSELVRIVKHKDCISIDKSGKANGRGAYFCGGEECLKKLFKQKSLNRAFKCNVDDTIYNQLAQYAKERHQNE